MVKCPQLSIETVVFTVNVFLVYNLDSLSSKGLLSRLCAEAGVEYFQAKLMDS
jgi:hypothetical protein